MKPHEFWDCTYREAKLYVQSLSLQREENYKRLIVLFENSIDKLIAGDVMRKHPKRISLIRDIYKEHFSSELKQETNNEPMSIEEQIRNLRSRM